MVGVGDFARNHLWKTGLWKYKYVKGFSWGKEEFGHVPLS